MTVRISLCSGHHRFKVHIRSYRLFYFQLDMHTNENAFNGRDNTTYSYSNEFDLKQLLNI